MAGGVGEGAGLEALERGRFGLPGGVDLVQGVEGVGQGGGRPEGQQFDGERRDQGNHRRQMVGREGAGLPLGQIVEKVTQAQVLDREHFRAASPHIDFNAFFLAWVAHVFPLPTLVPQYRGRQGHGTKAVQVANAAETRRLAPLRGRRIRRERSCNVTPPTISALGLHKAYGDVVAVDDISYEVFPGEIFAVLGPNGAGKTTTMRLTLGLIRPDQGSATLFGRPAGPAVYPRLGYLPEERGLYQEISVIDNLVYLASLKGLSRGEARKRALAGLERVELAEFSRARVKTLSRGMQQKVQFLATILHEPELIIIDEPFSGLDPVNTRLIQGILFDLAAAGTAIVMSTHQMEQIEKMAGRLMMISRGRRVLYGPVEEVRQAYASGSVLVRAEGDLAALNGVERIEARNGRVELFPEPGVTPQDLLRRLAAAPGVAVSEFEVATPSLDDIFVAVVGGETS